MRAVHAGSIPLVVSLVALLSACAGGPSGGPGGGPFAGGPGGPFGGPQPPRPGLFISPFGEPFHAQPGEPWPVSDWFLGADENLDGAIVFAEFEADGRRWFAQLDADRDGRLNQAELLAYEQSLRALGGGLPMGGGPRAPGLGEGGIRPRGMDGAALAEDGVLGVAPQSQGGPSGSIRRRGPQRRDGDPMRYGVVADAGFFNLPQPVKSADVNIDQRVTTEEWAQATQRWFLALDTDRDGRLTLATLPKTPLQARSEPRN